MRTIRIFVLVFVMLSAALAAFVVPGEKYFDIARSLDIFSTLFKEVNAYYVDEVNPKQLINTGINEMLHSLDPYTVYIPEEDQEAFSIQTTGQYAGIGALIRVVRNKSVVSHPYFGFPAHQAGVRVGDEFISVDGKNVQGKPTSEISLLLKGKPKTEVEVVVRRYGLKEDLHFKIQRERIKISNVVYQGMADASTGYIKLDDFTPGAGKEVEDALIKLKQEGAKRLILDLRDNPGGLLYEAVNIVNIFIPKGKEVVATKGKVPEWNKSYVTLNNPIDLEIPLAVLTSGGSASASEIVAGALQDYDRAILVGEKTFGKGLVQTTRPLSYNAQLKVTTAKYYIPSGRCIQAMDYANRKSDGTVQKFADSVKSEFKTQQGRKVFDGGGLDPDVLIQNQLAGTALEELVGEGYLFEYASKYCGEHPKLPPSLRGFKLSDVEYDQFIEWMKQQKFAYTSRLESQADQLIASAKEERYYDVLRADLLDLKSKIQMNKDNDWIRFRKEITTLLESEIAFHYQLNSGLAEISLDRDPEIVEARKVLADSEAYKKMLLPK
jgi:carboxyl-terminal processing protease